MTGSGGRANEARPVTVYDEIAALEVQSGQAMAIGGEHNTRAVVYELRALRMVATLISAQLASLGEIYPSDSTRLLPDGRRG